MKKVNSFDVIKICSIMFNNEKHISITSNSIVIEDRIPTMRLCYFDDCNFEMFLNKLKGNDLIHGYLVLFMIKYKQKFIL